MSRSYVTLADWLDYLERRHSREIQLGLERMKIAFDRLGISFANTLIITVGGTNGKGSTVAALDAIYTAAGFCVGRYTSPHLFRFNERICINQQEVSDEALCDVFERIHQEPTSHVLTYFEMTTLAALLLFEQAKVDVMILEVGLGGRLDATNVVDADLAIITTIDLDHQQWLGDTKEAIGFEKAGILRPHQLAIYADDEPPQSIVKEAIARDVKMYYLQKDYKFSVSERHFSVHLNRDMKILTLPKPGINLKAAAAAVFASQLLTMKLAVTEENLIQAMERVYIHGRQQWIQSAVMQLYDVAHNPQAVALLAESVARYKTFGTVRAVFSALGDKDIPGLLKPMAEVVHTWYPALLASARAASQEDLQAAFEDVQICSKKWYNTPQDAFEAALREAQIGDLVVVYGSFLTVGAVLSL